MPRDPSPDTPAPASRLYDATVMHHRLRPLSHRFVYTVPTVLLDLDDLPDLDRRCRLFGVDRRGLWSFRASDHGPRDGSPLRPWIEARCAEAGIDIAGGAVRILCLPRLFGYVFNPLTVWFCHDAEGRLRAVLHAVANTFGDRHGYLIPVDADREPGSILAQSCDKTFHVSPFIALDGRYRFRLREPSENLSIAIRHDGETDSMVATWTGVARPLDDRNLLRAALRFPLATFKVTAGIHWEALCLWIKGARFRKRTPPPADPVEIVPDGTRRTADRAAA